MSRHSASATATRIPTRPLLHFTPTRGWINDPHGITYRDGHYDVFFQYVPGQTQWGPNCHWGHAAGPDLLSLRELPVAIAPGQGDDGIWTGCLVTDDAGRTRVFYTSVTIPDFGIGVIRCAMPADEGWIEWAKGPIVAEAPTGLDLVAFRDPFVWREGESWQMLVGAARRDGTAMALSYVSADLESWSYAGVALQRSTRETEPVWTGALWECPQVFRLGSRRVMVSSIWEADQLHYAAYAVGEWNQGRFDAQSWGRLTYGNSYYAPSLLTDAEGRPCLVFWMRGIGDTEAGWQGAHSVPHLLSLIGGRLVASPHPDVVAHRGPLSPDGRVEGSVADIVWSDEGDATLVLTSGDTVLATVDRAGDTLRIGTGEQHIDMPVEGDVRIVVDGPVLEVSSAAGIAGAGLVPCGMGLKVTVNMGRVEVFPLT